MDLYGDLPPIQGDNNIITKGWAKPNLNNKINKKKGNENKKEVKIINNEIIQPSSQSSQLSSTSSQQTQPSSQQMQTQSQSQFQINNLTPKFAPFKPRQTNKQTINITPISNITQQKITSGISMSLPSTETVIRKKITNSNDLDDNNSNNNNISNSIEQEQFLHEKENIELSGGRYTYDCNDSYDPTKPNDYLK